MTSWSQIAGRPIRRSSRCAAAKAPQRRDHLPAARQPDPGEGLPRGDRQADRRYEANQLSSAEIVDALVAVAKKLRARAGATNSSACQRRRPPSTMPSPAALATRRPIRSWPTSPAEASDRDPQRPVRRLDHPRERGGLSASGSQEPTAPHEVHRHRASAARRRRRREHEGS